MRSRIARLIARNNIFIIAIFIIANFINGGVRLPAFAIAADEAEPDVGIFVVSGDEDVGRRYAEIVSDGNDLSARLYDSLEGVLRSDADVVIVAMARSGQSIPDKIVKLAKTKKVIGIGYGAAQLFGQLELEIKGDACAHFGANVTLQAQDSRLLGDRSGSDEFQTYVDFTASDNFGMYIPKASAEAFVVDVIARHANDLNYAPIVKQNNYVMVGLSGVPGAWTPQLQSLFRDVTIALRKAKQLPFGKAEFPTLVPGQHAATWGESGSTELLSSRTYYLKFNKPTSFTATLEHQGSNAMMMLFMGEKDRLHWTRQDARNGEPLAVAIEITAEDLKRIGDNYWTLKISNFDRANSANGLLKVVYDLTP